MDCSKLRPYTICFVLLVGACGQADPIEATESSSGNASATESLDPPQQDPPAQVPAQVPSSALSLQVPEGWTATDTSRYGLKVTQLVRDGESYDMTQFPEPLSLERFTEMTSHGRGFLETIRSEATTDGFIFVNTRDFRRGYEYEEVAVYFSDAQAVCTGTDLRGDQTARAIAFCDPLNSFRRRPNKKPDSYEPDFLLRNTRSSDCSPSSSASS